MASSHDLAAAGEPPPLLSLDDAARLAELEAVVERGIGTFHEVGLALMEIKGAKLYRASHSALEDYCRERWSFTGRHGYRLIEAASLAEESATDWSHSEPPKNEWQARKQLHPQPEAA